MTDIVFTRNPILGLMGCCVPVVPETFDVEAPMDQRTELCGIDAAWLVGAVPTCDIHAKYVCELVDIDWPELVAEAERDLEEANRPREGRERHSQAEVKKHQEHFISSANPL